MLLLCPLSSFSVSAVELLYCESTWTCNGFGWPHPDGQQSAIWAIILTIRASTMLDTAGTSSSFGASLCLHPSCVPSTRVSCALWHGGKSVFVIADARLRDAFPAKPSGHSRLFPAVLTS